jgi:HD-GYP domain-containing protein (c-di-GMP phosphodiesterase class II)
MSAARKLREANRDLLFALARLIEIFDPYTSGHSERVAIMARLIGKEMGLKNGEVDSLYTAAFVHDIGKADGAYVELIKSPEDLTDIQKKQMKQHPTQGALFLARMSSFSDDLIRMVHFHHERWDGEGYPSGLAGDEIPMGARIISVCDGIDAMASARPYREARSTEYIRAELAKCAGSQWDPAVVEVASKHLRKLFDEAGFDT